jgi:hypothetical protein
MRRFVTACVSFGLVVTARTADGYSSVAAAIIAPQ